MISLFPDSTEMMLKTLEIAVVFWSFSTPIPEIERENMKTHWDYHHSIGIIRQIMADKMFPLTLDGISDGIKVLV